MKEKFLPSKKRRKTNRPKLSVFAAYGGVFVLIISVITTGYQPPQPASTGVSVANAAVQSPITTPSVISAPSVDDLVATDVAANLAKQTNMPISAYVTNMSQSLAAIDELAQTSDSAIVKPQIVQPTVDSRGIIVYVVKKDDTLQSIAANFGLTTQTIRWANNMTGETVSVGKKLTIPPVNGVLYTVRSGDTVASVAEAYSANKNRVVSYNNLELGGLKPGVRIVIPDGVLPTELRPGYVAPLLTPSPSYYGISAGGDGYAYGYCTYYAAARRAQIGKPIPSNWGNASSWAYFAAAQGYGVGTVPRVGSIMQNGGGLGHVAIVEAVKPGVSITISEMNGYRFGGGWNRIGRGDIPWSQAANSGYQYIY